MKSLQNKPDSGFTLVELMVTLVVAFILSGAVYAAYKVQQRTSSSQGQVAEMQQNIRAAFYFLSRNLRMAGYDPTGDASAGITTATAGRIVFTQDITDTAGTGDSDGDINHPDETVTFALTADANSDGIPDAGGVAALTSNGGEIAENIERIQFFYTLKDGSLPANPLAPTAAEMNDVATVTVSILARSPAFDPTYVDNGTYTLADGTVVGPIGDNFRRRLLISEIVCRNMVM